MTDATGAEAHEEAIPQTRQAVAFEQARQAMGRAVQALTEAQTALEGATWDGQQLAPVVLSGIAHQAEIASRTQRRLEQEVNAWGRIVLDTPIE